MVTSRILVVDILANKVDPEKICGILVHNAHRVKEGSLEAFILTLFRQKNQQLIQNYYLKRFIHQIEDFHKQIYGAYIFLHHIVNYNHYNRNQTDSEIVCHK